MLQNTIVALLVGGCFVYALWTLAPKAPRSRLANWLLKLPLPVWMQKPLTSAARQKGSCGCDGCDGPVTAKGKPGPAIAPRPDQANYQPITFVRGAANKKTQR
jgi:hypothetical protein